MANIEISPKFPKSNYKKIEMFRKEITPNPYIEESLTIRNILKSSGPLMLPNQIENLYLFDDKDRIFKFEYKELNKPYKSKPDDTKVRIRDQEDEKCEKTAAVKLQFNVRNKNPKFKLDLNLEPSDMWGMRFVGRIIVLHDSGETCTIYLPGVLTFDPAGISGDTHSSERIGPSCARIQTGITIAQLFALQNGGTSNDVDAIQDAAGMQIDFKL